MLSLLASKNITFVLTIMSKDLSEDVLQQYREQGIEHMFVKRRDIEDENMLEMFGELCEVIEEKLRRGDADGKKQGVLVHCAMGVSRSVSVVLAYGMSMNEKEERMPHGCSDQLICRPTEG